MKASKHLFSSSLMHVNQCWWMLLDNNTRLLHRIDVVFCQHAMTSSFTQSPSGSIRPIRAWPADHEICQFINIYTERLHVSSAKLESNNWFSHIRHVIDRNYRSFCLPSPLKQPIILFHDVIESIIDKTCSVIRCVLLNL